MKSDWGKIVQEKVKTVGREIEDSYEVVVIGGGLAGVCACVAAARQGSKTAIIQDRPVFGGNSSSEIRIHISGANNGGAWARETGIIEEIGLESLLRNHEKVTTGMTNSLWDLVLFEKVKAEENLTYYLNTSAREVEMDGKSRIAAVICHQIGSERTLKIKGKYFIDCTGDGTVGAAARALFRMGREARAEFKESLAPQKADDKTQGSSLLFRARDIGRPVKFTPPPWAEDYPTEESLKRGHKIRGKDFGGYWWIEVGVPFNIIDQNEEIRDELLRHLLGVWDHIKNHGDHGAENMVLDWIGLLPGKRESRRLVGDHILTENDVKNNTPFPDRVAYGGWWIDIHTMGGILAKDKPPEALLGDRNKSDELKIELYSIPLRSLYSKNIANLLMAGRNISATHIALGTTRVMLTCAIMGQATGTAASLCLKHGITPRALAENHIEELQQTLIKDDCFIPDLPNRDPDDIAFKARVTATSTAPLSLEPSGNSVELSDHRGQIFPVSTERLEHISLHLQSSLEKETELTMEFLKATDIWHFNEKRDEEPTASKAKVPAGYQGWVDFNLGQDTARGLYRINLHPCEGISWSLSTPLPGVASVYKRKGWRRWVNSKDAFALRLDPPSFPFEPENVTSGVARPERGTNIWISDPQEPLPQGVTLDFGEEVHLSTVYLTFDTFLMVDFWGFTPLEPIKECVSDYSIQAMHGGKWKTVLQVAGNYQRRRIHKIDPPVETRQLKVVVLKTHGDKSARIYEVRVTKTNQDK